MTKTQIALIATGVVGVAVAYQYIAFLGSEVALMERFPDIEPKLVIKTHRRMIRNTLKGMYNDIDTSTDEVWDAIFLDEVKKMLKK